MVPSGRTESVGYLKVFIESWSHSEQPVIRPGRESFQKKEDNKFDGVSGILELKIWSRKFRLRWRHGQRTSDY